jgi:putative spermidine/putrescine transport system permease protein
MRVSRLTLFWLILPGAGFIFLFLALALAMTVLQSVGVMSPMRPSSFTLEFWGALFDRQFLDSFLFSLRVGFGSAFLTLLLAYPLALFLKRRGARARFLSSLIKIPLFVPALVAAFLILNALAFHGVINGVLLGLGIIGKPMRMLNDEFGWGVLAIQVWKNLPFQLVILASVLATIRSDTEEAARNLGAAPWQVVRHIILPLSMPGILIAVALVFIMTFGDFAITRVAGPIYPASLSVLMHTKAMTLQEWEVAACIGVVIIVASLLFVALYARMAKLLRGSAA